MSSVDIELIRRTALGMSTSNAWYKLRKNLLLSLVQRLQLDFCYRCGKKIDTEQELSVDHKIDWADSPDPYKFFFDLENISFSHLLCNTAAGREKLRKEKEPKPPKPPKLPKPPKVKKIKLPRKKIRFRKIKEIKIKKVKEPKLPKLPKEPEDIIGSYGGVARAKVLSPERRKEIASEAAKARWQKTV